MNLNQQDLNQQDLNQQAANSQCRGRPPKISATQQPTSTEFDNDPPSQPVASSQPVPRYNLRRRQH